jgi:hypothetical protein
VNTQLSLLLLLFGSSFIIVNDLATAAGLPSLSVQHGFFREPFTVVVRSTIAADSILYTLDGSDPQNSVTRLRGISPVEVTIDPRSTAGGRGTTPGVILRVCAHSADLSLSETLTATYLFVEQTGALSPRGVKPGPGWPAATTSSRPQMIDYGMAADVLNDARYKDRIDKALLAIPSVSIATDLKNLFDKTTGIYMNAYSDGSLWERPASIELLDPDGRAGFQVNAGIRIRGGASRSGGNPKHAFRLFFRGDYGPTKLEYPLFDTEGVDEFDKMDLRTGQNYSWSFPGHQGEYNTMISDVFSRDLQRDMGRPYTRSRFYHLWLNGVYWGLYQTEERPEARYAASYFGGSEEDYDVVKSGDSWPATIEATDGDLAAWREIWDLCGAGFAGDANYFKLQGRNADGSRNAMRVLVDLDNLIDFMLIVFYTGNFDCPTTKFDNNKSPRNFFALYNRTGFDGFQFIMHDAEHTLRTTAGEWSGSDPNIGVRENRVNIGTLATYLKMTVSDFTRFHPQWLHFKLTDNAEYRLRFADHVYRHLFNDGCMTPQHAVALFSARRDEIDLAIIAESARWGDTYASPSRTRDDDWLPALNDILTNYFPVRTGIVIDQLKSAGLYPKIDPPAFLHQGETLTASRYEVPAGYDLQLRKPAGANGALWYTSDGQDPRSLGGAVSSTATNGGDSVTFSLGTTATIKARLLVGTTWSALHEVFFTVGSGGGELEISEIHYHPSGLGVVDDKEFEFLELKNSGSAVTDLSRAVFIAGITFQFPAGTLLEPGHFLLLASNRLEFYNRYGFYPFAEYAGQLDNAGERFILCSEAGDTLISIAYEDSTPWPSAADGDGYSLVPDEERTTSDPDDPAYWRSSLEINGSPGRDDIPASAVAGRGERPVAMELEQNYPNPFNPETSIVFSLTRHCPVRLAVFDLLGREVSVLMDGELAPGRHALRFPAAGLAGGIYFYRLTTPGQVVTRKMMIIR